MRHLGRSPSGSAPNGVHADARTVELCSRLSPVRGFVTANVLRLVIPFSCAACDVSLVRGDVAGEGGSSAESGTSSVLSSVAASTTTASTSTASGSGGRGGGGGQGGSGGDGDGGGGGGGGGGGPGACGGAGQPCCPGDACAGPHLACDPVTVTCSGCAGVLTAGEAALGACISRKGTGEVVGWGSNAYRQITCDATGYTLPRAMPQLPDGLVVTQLGFHGCGITEGRVFCWGSNEFGECALPESTSECMPNEVVSLASPADDVDVTWTGTTVALAGGEVFAWGNDATGQVSGAPREAFVTTPTLVEELGTDNVAIAAGTFVTCALKAAGTVACIGVNDFWGLGTEEPAPSGAQIVPGLDAVDEIAAGEGFFCARIEGDVHCWGDNASGQVRLGSQVRVAAPLRVELGGPAQAITAGVAHACALLGDGSIVCWGENAKKQTGACDDGLAVPPTRVVGADGEPLRAKQVAAAAVTTCAIDQHDVVVCWGSNASNDSGVPYDDTLACPPVVAQIACGPSEPESDPARP